MTRDRRSGTFPFLYVTGRAVPWSLEPVKQESSRTLVGRYSKIQNLFPVPLFSYYLTT